MAGANTAWVPSPTAATLHAIHYHEVDVAARQEALRSRPRAQPRRHPLAAGRRAAELAGRGDPAGARQQRPGHPRLRRALDRPGRRLLEGARHQRRRADGGPRDAAHLEPAHRQLAAPRRLQPRRRCWRRSSAWRRWSTGQNAGDPAYRPMAPDFDASIAFQAACDLVFKGRAQPNGYTEPILHRRRREAKRGRGLNRAAAAPLRRWAAWPSARGVNQT